MSTQGQSPEAVIAECERLLKEITPGEWLVWAYADASPEIFVSAGGSGPLAPSVGVLSGDTPCGERDAAFIAAAPRLVRDLLPILRRQEEETSMLRANYTELLHGVEKKYPNETRHQTALRYIRERETHGSNKSRAVAKDSAATDGRIVTGG